MSPLILKIIIAVLFAVLVIHLIIGFRHLSAKQDASKNMNRALGFRAATALLMMAFVVYGITSGKLGSKAPWDARKQPGYEKSESKFQGPKPPEQVTP